MGERQEIYVEHRAPDGSWKTLYHTEGVDGACMWGCIPKDWMEVREETDAWQEKPPENPSPEVAELWSERPNHIQFGDGLRTFTGEEARTVADHVADAYLSRAVRDLLDVVADMVHRFPKPQDWRLTIRFV